MLLSMPLTLLTLTNFNKNSVKNFVSSSHLYIWYVLFAKKLMKPIGIV